MTSFGTYIRELREKAGWPQRRLAHELDMDVSILSKIENENRMPKKKASFIIETIARVFSVPEREVKRIYLSDEIAALLTYEDDYREILQICEAKVDYVRSKQKEE